MENEATNDEKVSDPQSVAVLTAEQVEQVAGGILGTGCRTCTSGRPMAFQNLAAAVNPAPESQALG